MILNSFNSFSSDEYSKDIAYCVDLLKGLKPDQESGIFHLRENMRLIVEEYETEIQELNKCLFEVHDYTLDIQYPLIGHEMTYFTAIEYLKDASAYQKDKDRTLYSLRKGYCSEIITGNQIFAIFFPGDPHSPKKAASNKTELIKKATIKIIID